MNEIDEGVPQLKFYEEVGNLSCLTCLLNGQVGPTIFREMKSRKQVLYVGVGLSRTV